MEVMQNDLIKAAQVVEHCQRNWDLSKEVPQEHIDTLVKVATTMPTKQNRNFYKLLVSTDPDFNKQCFGLAYSDTSTTGNRTSNRNNQINANVLFIYIENHSYTQSDGQEFDDASRANSKLDTAMAVGISSGALTLSAASLGYKTGYCACFVDDELHKLINSKQGCMQGEELPLLLIGVGHPNSEYAWNEVIDSDGNKIRSPAKTFTKSVDVFYV